MVEAAAPADLLLTGGSVVTMDAARRTTEALAVRDGSIVAVGSARDLRPLAGARTRVIELGGRMVLPGFQDAHVHPTHGGLAMIRCELHDARGRDGVLARIRGYAEANPDVPWILGSGWYMADFEGGTPNRELLDGIVADRPAYLVNRDGHGAWANSRALELAGIDRDTPDPADGRIERTADGRPQGTLHEGAMRLVDDIAPDPTAEEMIRALAAGQRYLHSLGITAWQDAWIEASDDAAYLGLVERGELTARVVGSMWWDRLRGLEQVEEMVARRDRGPAGRYATTSVKLMLDGVCENFTGALLEPYLGPDGRPTGNSGIDFIEPAVLAEAVTRIDAAGMQPHFHAIGDRAVRSALDAVEAARRTNGPSDTRPHVAHIQLIHPDDLPRFRQVGLVADMQPYWACHEDQMDVLTVPFIGPERTGWQYPFASLRRAGARLCGGSDWPVSTPDPFKEIEVAVERILDETRDREPFLPEERLTLQDGLEAYTISSAYVNHLDDRTGSLEVGKMADLVVVDRDLFAPDAGPIGDARVQLTLVEGVSVHDSADLGG